jgi:glycosyltransferase involved in cell wall biosynthesis
MGEWLTRLGHELTVVTPRHVESFGSDGPGVLRTFDLSTVGYARKLLRRPPMPSRGAPTAVTKPAPSWFGNVIVPDECLLTWGIAALAPVRRLVAERRVDCLITTGPPHSTHLLPMLLRRRPAWIADLRDGWCFESMRASWPTDLQARLNTSLERRALRAAERVIGVTRPIAVDAKARLGARAAYVPNGWDPELDRPPSPSCIEEVERLLDGERVNLVHTGGLSAPRGLGRDPRPLFEALKRLVARRPEVAARLRVVLAGTLSPEDELLLSEVGSGIPVEHVGSLARDTALALQRKADALLLLTSPTHISHASGKLFEYLTAGRPILGLASGNEAARIISETSTGITVHPSDVDGIVRSLEQVVDGTLIDAYAPHGLSRYIYPGPAVEVAELVEVAIAQRLATAGATVRSA